MAANQTYVVTGGASGIGLSVVQKLLSLSAVVHVMDLVQEAPCIEGSHTPKNLHCHLGVDVSSRESVRKAFQSILDTSPIIHGLVTCAAKSSLSETAVESDENFHAVMAVNLGGTWNAGSEFLRHVLSREGNEQVSGSVVTIGSTASVQAAPRISAYCTSKHAIVGLTKSWAQDFAPKGVRVNCVAPGVTDTPMLRAFNSDQMPDDAINHFLHAVPMKRLAKSEEIAETVIFLLGNNASFITGQVVMVNGGAV